ncbi:Diacylglycerol O-acyltransferase 2 [Stylophora pistillata]|uniref:Diacylglycerol O-acyltransferase 2 n=1 Tax=Stylophora pistillata TaxID=50429 RepID=A0A2B4R4M7_STYPI|nr:Diacylglycerol O-acyltransferase 2 [Stylophora pistillata]
MRDYYPITLVKTSDLDPQKNYIFGYHPHGVFTEGASIGLNTEACGFSEKFPGIIPHLSVTSVILKPLLYRDVLMSLGVIDVSRHSLEYNLTQKGTGHSVVIVVGGAAEIREMGFDSYALIVKRRKGFIKLALQTGSDLVPVFGFGQNNLYRDIIGGSRVSQYSRLQLWLSNFTSWLRTCFLPSRSPINVVGRKTRMMTTDGDDDDDDQMMTTDDRRPKNACRQGVIDLAAVGSPISVSKDENPTQEEIDKLHARYIDELKELYEKNKENYHPSERSELLII